MASTAMNIASSRSHSVLILSLLRRCPGRSLSLLSVPNMQPKLRSQLLGEGVEGAFRHSQDKETKRNKKKQKKQKNKVAVVVLMVAMVGDRNG